MKFPVMNKHSNSSSFTAEIEFVSMARPTESYSLYAQQFGRGLRPLSGKDHGVIIDHVGNVVRSQPLMKNTVLNLDTRHKCA